MSERASVNQPQFRTRILRYLSKALTVLILLGASVLSIDAVSGLFHGTTNKITKNDRAPASEPEEEREDIASLIVRALSDRQGRWIFYEQNWKIDQIAVDDVVFRTIWSAPPANSESTDHAMVNTSISMDNNFDLFSLLPLLPISRSVISVRSDLNGIRYHENLNTNGGFRLATIIRDGKEFLLEGKLAFRHERDKYARKISGEMPAWMIITFQPRKPGQGNDFVVGPLPLPDSHRLLCAKTKADRHCAFVIVKLDCGVEELKQWWNSHGWTCTYRHDDSSFFDAHCRKDGQELKISGGIDAGRLSSLIITFIRP